VTLWLYDAWWANALFWAAVGLLASPLLMTLLGRPGLRSRALEDGLGKVALGIDALNRVIGHAVAWLALVMVLLQFTVVLLRYVFGVNFLQMQEGVTYLHAALFLVAAGYTLLIGGHVRVDIFYRAAPPKRKAVVDLLGGSFLLVPVMLLIVYAAWPYVSASWAIFEGSKESSGLPFVYLLKSLILVFAVLLLAQAFSLCIHAMRTLLDRPLTENAGDHPAEGGGHGA